MGKPAVLLLDDGELDDVQELLQESAIPFARIRGGAIVKGTPPPRDLLIATPRRIDAVDDAIGDSLNPPVRVMVVNEDSNALRDQLRRNGFDYLVRRPVHTEALRLMILHCCYKGEERRSETRVAVGFEVSYRTGMLTRRGTLVDLSARGCRLLTRQRVDRGKRIKVMIPEALDASEPLTVMGRVVRVEGDKEDGEDVFRLGIHFETASDEACELLGHLIEDLARGPATLRPGADRISRPADVAGADSRAGAEAASDAESDRDERRAARRARYGQTIPAFGNRALSVLVGRDLSVGGMRVQREAEIEIGDRLHLAIYAEAREEPLLIWGTVDRDDGDEGLFVLFDAVDAETAQCLERLVADLPTIESLHDSEAAAMGTVLSEIVEAPAGEESARA